MIALLSERLRKRVFDDSDLEHVTAERREAATQLDALSARVKELEGERDDALERVDELERDAGVVSDEFEKDCWKAMRSLLVECKFDWRDVEPDGVSADDAREYIHDTLNDLESSWQRERDRATRAEQERDTLWCVMNDTARELGCASDNEVILEAIARLKQERDEAYERAAKVADDEATACGKLSSSSSSGSADMYRHNTAYHSAAKIAAAIRQLKHAAGPDKEKR